MIDGQVPRMRLLADDRKRLEVTVLRRMYPDAADYDDGNWLQSRIDATLAGSAQALTPHCGRMSLSGSMRR